MRVLPIIVTGLIIFFFEEQYTTTRHRIKIGEKLAAEAAPRAFSRLNPQATRHFLVIGDSTAVGTGSERAELSTAGRLAADFPDAEIRNLGVNGSRTSELIARLDALKGQRFDLILIQIGANDIVHFTDYRPLAADIAAVLTRAKSLSDRVLLLTSGNVGTAHLLPFGTRWLFTKRTREVREMFMKAAAEHGVTYVDIFREPDKDPFALEPAKYYAADYFHPSGEGYRDWYDHVKAKL